MPLPNPRAIQIIAREHGYVERREEVSSTLFFKDDKPNDPTLINVFYTTGGVMTKLSHPRRGYNELWRSDAYDSEESLRAIFANPRIHTGQGYRHAGDAKRGCVQCGLQKTKGDYSANQWRKGAGNAKCTNCVQQQRREGDAASDIMVHPRDIDWMTITDAIECDAAGCGKTNPTIRCPCAAPAYYCSESCKRRHQSEHSGDCRDLEEFRYLCIGQDPNVNSGLCNMDPSTLSQMVGHAMATQLSGSRKIEDLLLQAEAIHQANEEWERAIDLYQQVLEMGGEYGENLTPPESRQMFMGMGRCFYELGMYDRAIFTFDAPIEMNRGFPQVHKYLALSHLASGNRDLAIKTMKQAVLYEAPWSDDIIRLNKELLCELINGDDSHNPPAAKQPHAEKKLDGAKPGRTVKFHGLKGAAHLNGTEGTLVRYHQKEGRWSVRCEANDGAVVKARPANLTLKIGNDSHNPPTTKQSSDEKKLEIALRQLQLAGGREEEPGSDDEEAEDNPSQYLNELLAVADARYNLRQYSKAGSLYYRGYYAAMHSGSYMNNPAIFPIAHKMIQAMVESGEEHNLRMAHGMAQQNMMMPGHPAYIREDLKEVEKVMAKRGMEVERFGMGVMGGFGY